MAANAGTAKQGKKNTSGEATQMVGLAKGLAIAYAITSIVFIAYAIILTYTSTTEKHIALVAMICTVVSTIVAGFDSARSAKRKGLFWGILAGFCYAVILFLIGIVLGNGFQFDGGKITTILISLAGGGVGGILGINLKK